jgi:predicted transcriptional regulator
MEVRLNPDLEAKLVSMAAAQGCPTEALIQKAIERLVNYDDWFIRAVDLGLAAAEQGQFVTHADIGKMIDGRYPSA